MCAQSVEVIKMCAQSVEVIKMCAQSVDVVFVHRVWKQCVYVECGSN